MTRDKELKFTSEENANKIVHSLWIGEYLSSVELLTLKSFTSNGHTFYLWTYNELKTSVPEGAIIKDASEILSRENIFNYKNKNQFGHGKGSYAGFSDIFRYKLLYEHGGWWADMDVTCLKPLDFHEPYVFRTHHTFGVVGNLMKCPAKSELMRICYEQSFSLVNADNTDWNKPISILNQNIEKLKLGCYTKNISNADSWRLIRKMLVSCMPIPEHWYIIHWVNEEWRRNKIDKNHYRDHTTIGQLMNKYRIPKIKKTKSENFTESVRLSFLYAGLRQLPYLIKKYS